MPKDEWGVKRLCPHCTSRFFDLQRDPMTCPECGHTFTAESLIAGRGRVLISDKTAAKEQDLDMEDLAEDDLDALGMLKVDILALGMLTALAKALKMLGEL